jgi:dipeptidyl aminopeptidase/acylaminoacyl peptidase
LSYLSSILPRRITAVRRNPGKDIWLLEIESEHQPGQAILFDWQTRSVIGSVDLLITKATKELGKRLATTRLVEIPTRDGATLDAFLTIPASVGSEANPPQLQAPLIAYFHGGPGVQDRWEYTPEVQFLASRGYAVLQVNYRGSFGRGSDFQATADQILNGTAISDVIDALGWAKKNGYAGRGRIAVMGGSFGGYLATSVAARQTEDIACVISWVGVYDLLAFVEDQQRHSEWAVRRAMSAYTFGNMQSAGDRARLTAVSPLSTVNRINTPLLMVIGAKDDRVSPEQAMRFARGMQSHGNRPITLSFDHAGHADWSYDEDTATFNLVENFLSHCLGGRALPLDAELIARSSMRVLSDSGIIPGLKSAVPQDRYSATLLEGALLQ